MNENLAAAEDAKRLLRGFAGIQKLSDSFARVGQLQQAGDEAEARFKEVTGQVAEARQALAAAQTEARKTMEQATASVEVAGKESDALRAEGARQLHEAKAQAHALVTDAKREAQKAKDEADRHVVAAQASRDGLQVAVAALEEKLGSLRERALRMMEG